MRRSKKFKIIARNFTTIVKISFNSDKGNMFIGESQKSADEIFKKVLKGITEINMDISIEEIK
jgi:ribosomal protein S3